jgi:hypothetical protein
MITLPAALSTVACPDRTDPVVRCASGVDLDAFERRTMASGDLGATRT